MTSDQESFREWVLAAQPRLLRTAFLLTGDFHRAEDLLQEALTKVALRWRRLHDQYPDAYARQVIVRDNINWWRRHRHESFGVPQDDPVTSTDSAVDRRIVLAQALAQLTAKQRTVIVLRYFNDLSTEQAAEVMGVTTGTVKSQTHLALRRLREGAPELAELLEETP